MRERHRGEGSHDHHVLRRIFIESSDNYAIHPVNVEMLRAANDKLYALQDRVVAVLLSMNDPQLCLAKLCGGTALSRCWLEHRVSYDLDFFFAQGFEAGKLAMALTAAGIDYETRALVDDPYKANQLHGYVVDGGQRLKVSFVKDAYFSTFPVVMSTFGTTRIRTEQVEGLYHRKLRTVCGHAATGDSFEGGRQTARDVFDLYVLSRKVMPLRPFMQSLPYPFPVPAFDNGLASMPWFELMDELGEIVCAKEWSHAKDVAYLQTALYEQIGATAFLSETLDGASLVANSSISTDEDADGSPRSNGVAE